MAVRTIDAKVRLRHAHLMRKYLLSLLLALVLTVPAAAADLTPRLTFAPPAGFKVTSQHRGADRDTADYIPAADTADRWTAIITYMSLRNDKIRAADYIAEGNASTLKIWPGATVQILSNAPENGFETVLAAVTYPNAFGEGVPQVEYLKAIEGGPTFYFIRYSFRGQPTPVQTEATLAYLKSLTVCRPGTDAGC